MQKKLASLCLTALSLASMATSAQWAAGGDPNQGSKLSDLRSTEYLGQNWNDRSRQTFYFTPQGSHIMPYYIAMSLENADSADLFFTSANLARFGYIPQKPSAANKDGLPVGFTVDGTAAKPQMGMNCAACHVSQIYYKGRAIRIDGGPSMSDFQGFVAAMDAAVFATANDSSKLQGLIGRAMSRSSLTRDQVVADFQNVVANRQAWRYRNFTTSNYGHGRTDAFGIIFNQVLARDMGMPANAREPNAPVSYPVLWDTHQSNTVQWNGIAQNNLDATGPLSRNMGQVLGVFGDLNFDNQTLVLNGYCSSSKRDNLDALEKSSSELWAPQWPFGALDQNKVQAGRQLFVTNCKGCHNDVKRDDPNRIIVANMTPIRTLGTDALTAKNAATRVALTGPLQGKKLELLQGRAMNGAEPAALVLKHAVAGALVGSISPITCSSDFDTNSKTVAGAWQVVANSAIKTLFSPAALQGPSDLATAQAGVVAEYMKYKARPLDGIWASAPYLHNGSVKNLREMLLPDTARSQSFTVGCQEFDPVNVGFECDAGSATDPNLPTSRFNATTLGNSNRGHNAGTGLSNADRDNLLEYLKSI